MDKKLLDSLNNLSLALESIAASLKDKSEAQSATAKAMKGGDFIKEIKEINVGVKQLQKDTKQILANQQTIMSMGKKKDKGADATETLGKDKQKQKFFKEGIGVILLIAVAVLALGVAFKLIGGVNFLSVIALSIALPLLAIGFSKVHTTLKMVGFDAKKDGKNFVMAMVAISLGITLSSWILSMVMPLTFTKMFTIILLGVGFSLLSPAIYKMMMAFKGMSFGALLKSVIFLPLILPAIALGIAFASWAFQLVKPVAPSTMFTTIFIAIAFTIISFGIRKLLRAFKGIGPAALVQSVIFLPLILPAIAMGIALSSWALQLVKPISFGQFLTTVFIALAFTIISYGLKQMLGAFKGLKPTEILMGAFAIPILLVAISYAIAYSSKALAQVVPIGFMQFLTAVGIAIVFVIVSFAAKFIVKAIAKMKWSDVPKIPVFFVLVSMAIWLSSIFLAKTKVIDFMTMIKIAVYSVVLAIAVIAVGFTMWLLAKMKVKLTDVAMGSLMVVIIALAIMVSSHILAMGNYKKYPDWKWAMGVGLAIILFAPGVVILGMLAMADGGLSQILGAVMVLIIAAAIMATSHILSKGKYDKYPPLKWTLGTVAAMVPFALMAVVLGAIALTGVGLIAFAVGLPMILTVAETIVETSSILSKGKYDNKGMLGWALATTLLYAAFVPILLILGAVGIAAAVMDFFGPNPWEMARSMMVEIAQTIVDVSFVLGKGNYKEGPTYAWARGVSVAIGAFAPVYSMLMMNNVMKAFGGGGVGPDDFARAIKTVTLGIVVSAREFAKHSAVFKQGPPLEWAKGVSKAIGGFAPVFKVLSEGGGWFKSGPKLVNEMVYGIVAITKGIIASAEIFAKNKSTFDEGYPSKKWGEGVGAALGAFAPVFKALHEDTGWFTSGQEVVDQMRYGIVQIAYALTDAAFAFSFMSADSWKSYPSKPWAEGVKLAVNSFMDIFQTFEEKDFSVVKFTVLTSILSSALNSIATSAWIMYQARKGFTFKIPIDWTHNLGKNVVAFANYASQLDKILGYDEKISTKSGGFAGFGGSTTETTKRKMKDISIIGRMAFQLGQTAFILYAHRKAFSFKLPIDWTINLGKNVLTYAFLTNQLDKMLGTDEKISTKSGGVLGIGETTTTKTERKLKDLSVVNRVVNQMATTGIILFAARKFFDPKIARQILDWSLTSRRSILMYARLAGEIERALTIKEITTISYGHMKDGKWSGSVVSTEKTKTAEVGVVNRLVNQLVTTAGILWMNRKFFTLKLDEDYMRKVKRNILDFASIVRYLNNDKTLSGEGGIKSMLGLDPISNTARGMIKMAGAFDTLAKSLNRFSAAIRSIDQNKINAIRKLTGNIAILSSMDSVMFNKMLTVLESRASVFGKLLDVQGRSMDMRARPTVGKSEGGPERNLWSKKSKDQGPVDSKGENALVKLDRIADLLIKITKTTDAVNDYMAFAAKHAKATEKNLKKIAKHTDDKE